MYRRTIVDPMSFRRTKVDPLKVGEPLLILQCIACMNLFERKLYLIQESLEFTWWLWTYLEGLHMGDLTWMRHSRIPLVYFLNNFFWNLDFFFFFLKRWWWSLFLKMNEAWPNAPSLQIDAWFLKALIFEEKMISFFLF